MSDPMTPEDGENGHQQNDYENLEDKIYALNEREADTADNFNQRLEQWQLSYTRIIAKELNTSKTKVMTAAIELGLEGLREDGLIEELSDIVDMRIDFEKCITKDMVSGLDTEKYLTRINENEPDKFKASDSNLTGSAYYIPVKESILAEISDNYINESFVGTSLYRVILARGLSESCYGTQHFENMASRLLQIFKEEIMSARRNMEDLIMEYISGSHYMWVNGGVDSEVAKLFRQISDLMDTRREEQVRWHLEEVEDELDIEYE